MPEGVTCRVDQTQIVMGDSQITTACTTPAEPADVSGSNAAQGSETTPSTSSNLLVVPEGKVLVWDKNMEQYVMKDKEDKKPKVCVCSALEYLQPKRAI